MAIVFVGDLHFRDQEPYHTAGIKFIEWFESQEFNREGNTLVQLGDVTHNSILNGRIVRMFMNRFFKNLKFDMSYIIQGNHDVDNKSKSSILEPLKDISGIEVVDQPCVITIEGKEFLCLPHLMENMKKIYEDLYSYLELEGDPNRIVIGHIADESQTLFGKFIDLSYLKEKKRILGHVHKRMDNYLGTPFKQRYDERNENNRILIMEGDEISEIPTPSIVEFVTVKYGDDVIHSGMIPYIDVVEAPGVEPAHEMYEKFFIRKVSLKESDDSIFRYSEGSDSDEKTIIDYFNEFAEEKQLSEFESTKIIDKLNKVEVRQ